MNFNFSSEDRNELLLTLKWSVIITVLIVLLCYLIFDFHVVNKTKRILSLQHPRLVIIDVAGVTTYDKFVKPIAKKKNVPIGIMTEYWTFVGSNRLSPAYLAQTDAETFYRFNHIKKGDLALAEPLRLKEKLLAEKALFDKHDIKVDYIVYPWDGANVKPMKPLVQGIWQGGIVQDHRPCVNYGKVDKYQLCAYNVGFRKPMTYDELAGFVDLVNRYDGLGILMIRSFNEYFTPAARRALEDMIDYALQCGVEICTLKEGLK